MPVVVVEMFGMIARCIENAVFAITANRFGSDIGPGGTLTFTGQSQVVAPKGEVIYRAKAEGEALFIADIDLGEARNKWITEKNDLLEDRRPEYYRQLCDDSDAS